MKQWNSNCGTLWGHSGTVWWYSGTLMVEQCNETVERYWWNSVGAQWNSEVQQCGGTVEH